MLSSLAAFDRSVYAWIVTHRLGIADGPLWVLSVVSRGGLLWLILGAGVAITKRRPRAFLQLVLATVLATAAADYVIKPIVHRERPFARMTNVEVIGGRPHDASLPSGHSANAFAGALVMSRLVPGASAAWWTLAVAIAYSRVYLGVHYPFDVVAGALVGLGCAALVIIGYRP
jgi:undecaprenyl-diphosphatase